MPMKHNITDRTPEPMRCAIVGCPAIYELTPQEMQCLVGACNRIYAENETLSYLIVGK